MKKEILKEFKKEYVEITDMKKKLPEDIYIKYLEKTIKILLKANYKLNKLEIKPPYSTRGTKTRKYTESQIKHDRVA